MKVTFTGELIRKDEGILGDWIGVVDPDDHFMPLSMGCCDQFVGMDVKITVETNSND